MNLESRHLLQIGRLKFGWAQILSLLVFSAGMLTILGWIYDFGFIVRPMRGLVAMNPTTALLFILSAVAVCLTTCGGNRIKLINYGKLIAGVVGLTALLRLSILPEIDLWFLHGVLDRDMPNGISNRMAPNTSITFLLASVAIILSNYKKYAIWVAQYLASLVALFGIFSVVGYQLQVPEFYKALARFPMSISTAVTFILLSQSILWIRTDIGVTKVFSKPNKVSVIARRALPLLVFLPMLLGVYLVHAHQRGQLSLELSLAIVILVCMVGFPTIVWFYVRSQNYIIRIGKQSAEIRELLDRTKAQNERLLGFSNTVSHNLRSNAVNIQSLVDFVRQDNDPFVKTELFQMIEEASKSFKDTIDNLFEITKVENLVSSEMTDVTLNDTIRRTVSGLRFLSNEAGVSIRVEASPDHKVKAVPAFLDSIVSNLVSNGIKYRSKDKSPEVLIRSQLINGLVSFSVRDNGLGMNMDKVGGKLFGLHKTFHGNDDASGIGLFLVKNQVEAMNGKIEVESAEGEGTTFTVTLQSAVSVQGEKIENLAKTA